MIKWVTKLMATLKKKAGKGKKRERESVERSKYGSKKKKKEAASLHPISRKNMPSLLQMRTFV